MKHNKMLHFPINSEIYVKNKYQDYAKDLHIIKRVNYIDTLQCSKVSYTPSQMQKNHMSCEYRCIPLEVHVSNNFHIFRVVHTKRQFSSPVKKNWFFLH